MGKFKEKRCITSASSRHCLCHKNCFKFGGNFHAKPTARQCSLSTMLGGQRRGL